MKQKAFIALAALFLGMHAQSKREWIHPFDVPQSTDAPGQVLAVIEIPTGTFTKYELDKTTGYPVVDRFQASPVAYPANYGGFPSTLAGDGDPLDLLVFTREPVVVGAFISVRPIGVLKSTDGGEQDDKIITVPTSAIDSTYDDIKNINDLPVIERERIEMFFRVYKQIPAGRKKVELHGFGDASEAKAIISDALERYKNAH